MGTEKNKKRKKCKTYITKLHKTLLEKSRGKAKNWFSVKLLKEQSRFQTEQSCLPTLRARWHKSKLLQLEERVEPMSFLPTWKGKTSFQRSKVCLVGEKQQSHTPDMLISNLTLESYDSVIIVSFESSKRCFFPRKSRDIRWHQLFRNTWCNSHKNENLVPRVLPLPLGRERTTGSFW